MDKSINSKTVPKSLVASVSGSVILPSHLRIGNLINSKLLGTNHIVQGFIIRNNRNHLYTDLQDSYSETEDWQGVEITENFLLKIGFEVIYRSNFTLRFDHKENFKFGAGWNLVNDHFHIRFIGEQFTNIKYVHELQNLYFSITGSELQLSV